MKSYGIKAPGIENEASIKKCALKYRLDTSNIVTIGSTYYLQQLRAHKNIPDAAIFDSYGRYIEYRATDTSCNAGLFSFIPNLNRTGTYNKTGKTTLDAERNTFNTLKGAALNQYGDTPLYDFYVLIYWTTYIGYLNKDHVHEWEQLAMQNRQAKIKVIKVNLDLQQNWPAEKRDSIIQKLSGKK